MTEKVSPGAVPASAFAGTLPDLLGIEFEEIVRGSVTARLELRPHHMAPNGFLHAGTVVALADPCCIRGTEGALAWPRIAFMVRRFLATRRGLLLVLALEAMVLLVILPRVLKHLPVAVYLVALWGLATALYFSNYRMWRWLQCSPQPRRSN